MPSRGEEIRRALERARDHTLELEAREAALEELRESGALDDDDDEEDDPEEELDALDVEAELQRLTDELGETE